jgi:GH15 family glucan-1,4-alpha-glucosidase
MSTLELGVIGNCSIAALIDRRASINWCCLPRFDGDPVFHALVDGEPQREAARGFWSFELDGYVRSEQHYLPNTAILITRLYAADGAAIEVRDFCPRFHLHGRTFRPQMIVRRVLPLSGSPRVRVCLRPSFGYGECAPGITHGSNHVRYVGPERAVRLTTNAPPSFVLAQTPFLIEEPTSFILGPDETLREGVETTARDFDERTEIWWRMWTRRLALPLEWQDAVIRAAITLKLCTFEETGAIVAALTTSIPEAPNTERNWDYRYCWLRDALFVIRALNSLAEVETMELYLRYIANIVGQPVEGHLQPVYGIGLEKYLPERNLTTLAGYRGMGPVRIGNQAHEHFQHDVYGNVVLAAAQSFFDHRLLRPGSAAELERLERVGEQAYKVYRTPDAGMWELRTRERVHTTSALMCWAACDRLGKIAQHFGRDAAARVWSERAREIGAAIETEAWNARLGGFADSFGGSDIDGGLLLMAEVGFLPANDPRFAGTVTQVERQLRRDRHLLRYAAADDFGVPTTAFTLCTFWYIDALARVGRRAEARELFEQILACRNPLGLLSEDVDPETGELWGNFPQTYSMVGIINAAMRLSKGWEHVV